MNNIETKIQQQAEKTYQAADNMDSSALDHLAELNRLTERFAQQGRQRVRDALEYVEALGLVPEFFYLSDEQDVQVSMMDGCLRVELEGLLPFATKGSAHYLHEKLEKALRWFVKQHELTPPIFQEKCAVVFVHHYDGQGRRYLSRQLRDFDNLEHRALMNTITRICAWDDSPTNIISMDYLKISDRDFTEVLVMGVSRFKAYLMSEDMSAR